jgi:enoyl-CoA hydratase/carnithine racemase
MAVTFTSEGPLGFITLDKPPANSYDLAFMTEFSEAVDEAVVGATRVVIVQSASEKFFSAGADIKKFLEGDVSSNMEMIKVSQAAFRRMAAAPQVFIAYIAGHALGGGLEIALACDIRLAGAGRYKMGLPEVTLGLLPGNGGTQRLTRLIGPSRALELLLTGRTYTVEEAREMGLVADVYNTDEGADRLREYASKLAGGPGLAIAAIKRCVHEGGELALANGLALEGELMATLFRSKDASEGLNAFVEKRKPEFVGA